jgi:hypothetical protein
MLLYHSVDVHLNSTEVCVDVGVGVRTIVEELTLLDPEVPADH